MIFVYRVSKRFPLYSNPAGYLLEKLPTWLRPTCGEFWALKDVSLQIKPGEFLAIVGPNGCGKSTLLQVISGVLQPTTGRVIRAGRLAAVLELGAGFNLECTGRENVRLYGEMLGIPRREMERRMVAIEAFAELGQYMERPVKEYSAGMYVRLAFSAAIQAEPDILVVDEALAVGDASFSNRCIRKFEELKKRGTTVVFVSHDLGLVKALADRAVLLIGGRVALEGTPSEVANRYVAYVLEREANPPQPGQEVIQTHHRHGDGSSRITAVLVRNARGLPASRVLSGEQVTVEVHATFFRAVDNPMVGVLLRDRKGIEVYGTNTRLEGIELGRFFPGDKLQVKFTFDCLLAPQEYTVTVATQHANGLSQDWLDDVLVLTVEGGNRRAGLLQLGCKVDWSKG